MTALIGGVIIGLSTDWLGRFVLPAFVALVSCAELYFRKGKGTFNPGQIKRMKESGVSANEIEDIEKTFASIDSSMMKEMKESGITTGTLYRMQFVSTYITTLVIAIVTGVIKLLIS